ncbi:MAG TPA: hypothetical protein VD902_14680 [Symbiobacteriaceae bacterium]|nr:hypothetical protein [Symbiobacteriaceae bacterium]
MTFTGRQAFFRIIRNTKSLAGARRMVHYIAFRSRELPHEQKGGFDRDHDQADVDRFCKSLDHRLTRHRSVPVAFHGIFSLPRAEMERAGLTDWKGFVREVMAQYETDRQIRLEWFASVHDSEAHPHTHIIIKAVYTNKDGREIRLRFNKEDLRQLRRTAGQTLAHRRWLHQAPERAARAMALEQARATTARLMGFQHALDWLTQQIQAERRRREREIEDAHQRWLRDD